MKVKYGHRELELYDSIEDAPYIRYNKYNWFIILDSNIGSDLVSINQKLLNIYKYFEKGDSSKAVKELKLIQQTLFFMANNVSPEMMAFVCLLKSIDGRRYDDLSEGGIKETSEELSKFLSKNFVLRTLETVKKNFDNEKLVYFPQRVDTSSAIEYLVLSKKRLLIECDILLGEKLEDELAKIDDKFFSMYEPRVFDGSRGLESDYKKNYEDACLSILQNTNLKPKELTVFEFWNAIDFIKDQIKRNGKSNKR